MSPTSQTPAHSDDEAAIDAIVRRFIDRHRQSPTTFPPAEPSSGPDEEAESPQEEAARFVHSD